jgi:DnaK suppressor protein
MTSVLSVAQRSQLISALLLRQQQLDRQLADVLAGSSRVDHASELQQQDSDGRARHAADLALDLSRSDQHIRELGAISDALRRLKSEDFGICLDCEEPIAFARLSIEPWALRCTRCEAAHDGHAAPRPPAAARGAAH